MRNWERLTTIEIHNDYYAKRKLAKQIQVKCQHVNDQRVVEAVTTIWNEVFT